MLVPKFSEMNQEKSKFNQGSKSRMKSWDTESFYLMQILFVVSTFSCLLLCTFDKSSYMRKVLIFTSQWICKEAIKMQILSNFQLHNLSGKSFAFVDRKLLLWTLVFKHALSNIQNAWGDLIEGFCVWRYKKV